MIFLEQGVNMPITLLRVDLAVRPLKDTLRSAAARFEYNAHGRRRSSLP